MCSLFFLNWLWKQSFDLMRHLRNSGLSWLSFSFPPTLLYKEWLWLLSLLGSCCRTHGPYLDPGKGKALIVTRLLFWAVESFTCTQNIPMFLNDLLIGLISSMFRREKGQWMHNLTISSWQGLLTYSYISNHFPYECKNDLSY